MKSAFSKTKAVGGRDPSMTGRDVKTKAHKALLTVDVLTLFPAWFEGPFSTSLLKRAVEKGLLDLRVHDIRAWSRDKHHKTDDIPYGGGAGMVMQSEPLEACLKAIKGRRRAKVYYLSPQGRPFTNDMAVRLAGEKAFILLCGHYEGIDERVLQSRVDEEISLGDFVLTGGEPAAAAVVDATARMIPGVVGRQESVVRDSFYDGLLDYPHYTRPRVFRGMEVPEVLLSGDHRKIERWRRREALRATLNKRPDLLETAVLKEEDRKVLQELEKETKS
jgi:tRNA (guanine37-N1)-methyltransferase